MYERGMNELAVLVVDDEPDRRGLLRSSRTRGFAVREAESGRAALRALYSSPPALVILDVTKPGLDGWQTLARIRDPTDAPVLMLSARAGEVDRVRGLNGAQTTTSPSPSAKRS
jgi:two-component system KDP operon response regulator KdpE